MKKIHILLLFGGICLFCMSCNQSNPGTTNLKQNLPKDTLAEKKLSILTFKDSVYYSLGLSIGKEIRQKGITEIDDRIFNLGLQHALQRKRPDIKLDSANMLIMAYTEELHLKNAYKTIKEGDRYIDGLKKERNYFILETGLLYKINETGTGKFPKENDIVKIHYNGYFISGEVFDSTIKNNKPVTFSLNWGTVLKGWKEALLRMPAGSKWTIVLPPHLAYGEKGFKNHIPPYKTLIFDIELLEIIHEDSI